MSPRSFAPCPRCGWLLDPGERCTECARRAELARLRDQERRGVALPTMPLPGFEPPPKVEQGELDV